MRYMLLFLIKTIGISVIILFLIQQIVGFLQKNARAPKIKTPAVEKYKTLLAAAAATTAAAAAAPAPEIIDITDDTFSVFSAGGGGSDMEDDNESVYSAGYYALKREMGDDLAELVSRP